MTVLDVITRSLRLLGALDPSATPEAVEASNAFDSLNALLDSWGSERLTFYTTARTLFNVVAGQQVYQLGPTAADWIAPRPQYIDRAGLIITGSDPTQTLERPLHILRNDADWARIGVKGVQSTLPTKLYYQSDYPNGQVALWPDPTQSGLQVALYTPVALTQFAALTDDVDLPPAYLRALTYGLAVELAPEFGAALRADVIAIAEAAKTSLKRVNFKIDPLRTDIGTSKGAYDFYVDEVR